jgi:diguanylate cyclase (GGDEF)-like protein
MATLRATGVLFTPAEERFDRITRLACQLLGTPIALVSLVADQCQWFKSAQGLDASETPREISFCGHAILGDETFVVEDANLDRRFSDNPLVTGPPHIRFYAGQPLNVDGSRVGTLCVIDQNPRRFTPEQLQVLRDLGGLVETELHRGYLNEAHLTLLRERDELQRKAAIDDLTRLWNRAAAMELLGAELSRVARGTPVCVAMIDADHFKRINDTYGHQTGDAVLVEMATRIRQSVRDFDIVGRYGGEEFIVVLSNCNLENAQTICDRICHSVSDREIATPTGPLFASVSIGLATSHSARDGTERLTGAADEALYRAKAKGRNRIEISDATGA